MKAFIVPIFIPNVGCPTRCVFCEQPRITSQPTQIPSPETVSQILCQALRSRKYRSAECAQVAFYGGTFTRLPLGKMKELLEAVRPFVEKGYFESIRVSTRPDALELDRLELMQSYGVRTVELGAQSMDDKVLVASNRGHTVADTVEGVGKLGKMGFCVGIQLMPGLPGETEGSFQQTVTKTIGLRPDAVRIYPTVVIKGTKLARMFEEGHYTPLSLDKAVRVCADAVIRFEAEGIKVIRIGLMSSPRLLQEGEVIGGPWHPCFGGLVRSLVYHMTIALAIPKGIEGKDISVIVNPRDEALFRGYRNQGLHYMEKNTGARVLSVVTDPHIQRSEVRINRV